MPSTPKKRPKSGSGPRRLGVADAKSRFAEVLRDAEHGVTIIHRRGHDIAVVLSIDEYGALLRRADLHRGGAGGRLVSALAGWRSEHGGVDFDPERVRIVPEDFSPGTR